MKKLIDINDPLFQWVLHPNNLYEYGIELGVSSRNLLENTKLTTADIENVELKISWLQYKELAENVRGHCGEDWGFQFGKRLSVSSHGLLSLLLLNCSDWQEVIELMVGLPNLVSPIFYVSKKETDEYVTLTVHPEATRHPILDYSMETLFTSFYQMMRQLGGEDLENSPDKIRILVKAQTPNHNQLMKTFFQENISWGHYANEVRIKKTLLERKIPNANAITASSTKRMLYAQLSQLPATKGGLNELRELFQKGIYKQEKCAEYLFTTVPTLKRFLKSASTSFSNELAIFRVEEACWFAENTNLTAAEVSEKLGFQDANSFARFFKQSLGVPFNSFRG